MVTGFIVLKIEVTKSPSYLLKTQINGTVRLPTGIALLWVLLPILITYWPSSVESLRLRMRLKSTIPFLYKDHAKKVYNQAKNLSRINNWQP